MTVVCWDGTTLAADKMVENGRTVSLTTKIHKVNGSLVGLAGDLSYPLELLHWFRYGADPSTFPRFFKDPHRVEVAMLVISPDGSARQFLDGPFPARITQTHAAIGCGEESAYVAMACGLDAKAAVEMVCRFNSGCGGGVDTLTLI